MLMRLPRSALDHQMSTGDGPRRTLAPGCSCGCRVRRSITKCRREMARAERSRLAAQAAAAFGARSPNVDGRWPAPNARAWLLMRLPRSALDHQMSTGDGPRRTLAPGCSRREFVDEARQLDRLVALDAVARAF